VGVGENPRGTLSELAKLGARLIIQRAVEDEFDVWLGRTDYRPLLRELDIPTFVCTGSEDPWSNETVTAEIIDHLRHPELLVVQGAGHLPNLEAEDVFTPKLTEFLARHAPR
jgi:pimeloyl-ACP methyl ester carboxylesterase